MLTRQCSISVLFLAFLVPSAVQGAVVVSEVAWMGTAENANAEWIELYNDGDAVTLDGWTLNALDGQPAIELRGTLGSNSYALLERTSDETLPGKSAFVIYTGALGNSGEVLELRDAAGTLVDRVSGGDEWAIGGDNTTKDTLQRSGDPPVGSFVTGAPTPASALAPGHETATVSQSASTGSTRTTGGGMTVRYGTSDSVEAEPHLEPGLILVVPAELEATAGVPVELSVRAYRESGKEQGLRDVSWAFGDGGTGQGQTTSHTYSYPGTYLAVVRAARSGLLDEVSASARITVHVVEPSLSIDEVTDDYVALFNGSANEVDLSSCVFALGAAYVKLADGTMLLPGATVRFPVSHELHAYSDAPVVLYRPGGIALAAFEPVLEYEIESEATTSESALTEERDAIMPTEETYEEAPRVFDDVTELLEAPVAHAAAALMAAVPEADAHGGGSNLLWWLLALAAAIVTAIASILLSQERQEELALDFEIEGDE